MNKVHFVLFLLIQFVCMLCMNVCKKKRAEKMDGFCSAGGRRIVIKCKRKGFFGPYNDGAR